MRWWQTVAVGTLVGGTILTGTARAEVEPVAQARRSAGPARGHHGRRPRVAPVAPPVVHGPRFDPCLLEVPPPPPKSASWIRVGGFKSRGPKLNRSEGGLTLALADGVALQLHYERTAQAPMMRHDHDDGFLTRLRVTF